jgi:hypothetical protein
VPPPLPRRAVGAAGDGDGGRGSAAVRGEEGRPVEDGWIRNRRAGGKAGAAATSRVWRGGGAGLQQLAARVGALTGVALPLQSF